MKQPKIKPQVTLVGAGPGDPELISIKGMKALQTANVVLYDALVHPDTLAFAPLSALKIYTGKRAGRHRYRQQAINRMIVQHAYNYGHVVRLKGGDPFVFGRGHEELEYIRSFDLPVTIVPGISSCYSVPELQSIPLTRRGINESFWVITGTRRTGELSHDMRLAAQSSATVVILMGLRKLPEIAAEFAKAGRAQTPVAVIQKGSLPGERLVLGNVETIVETVVRERIETPAIIVIGEVVRTHRELAHLLQQRIQNNFPQWPLH